jgi:hypothetical protein
MTETTTNVPPHGGPPLVRVKMTPQGSQPDDGIGPL